MRPVLLSVLSVGPLAAVLTAAPVPKELKKADDAAAVLGSWKPVRYNGHAEGATAWFRFAADGTMRTWHEPAVGTPIDWKWSVDPAATPKRMTLTNTDRAGGGTTTYDCVYELDGATLRIGFVTNPKAGVPEKVEPHPAIQLYEMTRAKDVR